MVIGLTFIFCRMAKVLPMSKHFSVCPLEYVTVTILAQ